jgi:hypothetical protein
MRLNSGFTNSLPSPVRTDSLGHLSYKYFKLSKLSVREDELTDFQDLSQACIIDNRELY